MRSTPLGNTGIEVSVLGFGGMPLSIRGRPPEPTAREVLHAVFDAGIDFIDTADVYCLDDSDLGHNERLIASVLAERRDRDRIRVATKGGLRRPLGAWVTDSSPQRLIKACERSLRALGVDRIFVYQLHAPPRDTPFQKSIETLGQLKDAGKIEHIGLSNVSVADLRTASRIVDVVTVQNRLSPFYREPIRDGVLAECDKKGITFLAYSPLGGKRRSRTLADVPALQTIAHARGVSPHAVAVAWVRATGKRVVPIPAASSVEHARDTARAAEIELTPGELDSIHHTRFSDV
ncbi:MAG TPA: aldo/keto reductase [Thermoanaerobaculia bacterium]